MHLLINVCFWRVKTVFQIPIHSQNILLRRVQPTLPACSPGPRYQGKNYGKAVGKTRLEKGKEGNEGGRMESTYDSAKWYT